MESYGRVTNPFILSLWHHRKAACEEGKLSKFYISRIKHSISGKPLLKHVCNLKSDVTPADTMQCLQARPYFLTSSSPLSLSSSFMRSFQPSPSYPCLIHFPSNNPGALWFICLWSLLTLTNTFRFSPLLRSLLAELLGAVGNNNYFFLAWSQSFASSHGTTLRQAKGKFCFSGFISSLPKPAKTKNLHPIWRIWLMESFLAFGQYSTPCKLRVKSKKKTEEL